MDINKWFIFNYFHYVVEHFDLLSNFKFKLGLLELQGKLMKSDYKCQLHDYITL
jgi:hypothetical protein